MPESQYARRLSFSDELGRHRYEPLPSVEEVQNEEEEEGEEGKEEERQQQQSQGSTSRLRRRKEKSRLVMPSQAGSDDSNGEGPSSASM